MTFCRLRCLFAIAITVSLALACRSEAGASEKAPAAPQNLRVIHTEKSLDLSWDSVPGVRGYHIYTAPVSATPMARKRRVNPALITSGMHFTYIWDVTPDGQRARGVKGYAHHVVVTAVAGDSGAEVESGPSNEIDNAYFTGFSHANTRGTLLKVLRERQKVEHLPIESPRNGHERFIEFMCGPAAHLQKLIRDTIDAREVGACAPLATVLAQLMLDTGLVAWKAEGAFIKEYHAFVIVNVEGVEYVVDVAADQFVPDVSPVVVPRDLCFLNARGRFAEEGTPVYAVGKLFAADKSVLVDSEQGELYRGLLEKTRAWVLSERTRATTPSKASKAQPRKGTKR